MSRILAGQIRDDELISISESEDRPQAAHPGAKDMTVLIFTLALFGAMTVGLPIAFARLICGAALMVTPGQIDTPSCRKS